MPSRVEIFVLENSFVLPLSTPSPFCLSTRPTASAWRSILKSLLGRLLCRVCFLELAKCAVLARYTRYLLSRRLPRHGFLKQGCIKPLLSADSDCAPLPLPQNSALPYQSPYRHAILELGTDIGSKLCVLSKHDLAPHAITVIGTIAASREGVLPWHSGPPLSAEHPDQHVSPLSPIES